MRIENFIYYSGTKIEIVYACVGKNVWFYPDSHPLPAWDASGKKKGLSCLWFKFVSQFLLRYVKLGATLRLTNR